MIFVIAVKKKKVMTSQITETKYTITAVKVGFFYIKINEKASKFIYE